MAKYSNTKAKINEKIITNGAQAVTGSILNDVLQTMVDSLGADYQFGGLVQPGSSFTAGEQPVVFLATTPGTYTNFGGLVVADGEVALLVWSGSAWSKQTPDIATRTEVGQLGQEVIYDVTMNNPTAGPNNDGKFESLSALLSDENLSTLIPSTVRCGGMSIRFVQTSDNKYVHFNFLLSGPFTESQFADVSNWQYCYDLINKRDAVPLAENTNLNSLTYGLYSFTNAVSSTLRNAPRTSGGGYIMVEKTTVANDIFNKQTIIYAAGYTYVRYDNESWIEYEHQVGLNAAAIAAITPKPNIFCYFSGRVRLIIEDEYGAGFNIYIKPSLESSSFNIYKDGSLLESYNDWAAFAAAINKVLVTSPRGTTNCIAVANHEYIVFNVGSKVLATRGNGELLIDDIILIHNVGQRCLYVAQELYNANDVKDDIEIVKTDLQNQINTLGARVEDLETSGVYIPSWWQSYMETKIGVINEKCYNVGNNGDNFVFITDIHQESNFKNSPKLINYITKHTPVKNVVIGGDLLSSAASKAAALSAIQSLRNDYNFSQYILPVIGNHDLNITNDISITLGEYYAIMLHPLENIVTLNKEPYYYKDNLSQKIRYIFVDGSDVDNAISSTQKTWMQGKFTELQSDWTVVIFSHTYWDATVPPSVSVFGTSLVTAINEIVGSIDATIAAVITGHVHRAMSIQDSNGYWIIATPCDAGYNQASSHDDVTPTRTAKTTSEQVFDVFNINTNTKKIYVTRIGGNGEDREFTYQ